MRKLVGDFVGVLRELSLDELRESALTAPRLLICGERTMAQRIALGLVGSDGMAYVQLVDSLPGGLTGPFDIVICIWSGGDEAALRAALVTSRSRGWPVAAISTVGGLPAALALAGEILAMPGAGDDWQSTRRDLLALVDEVRYPAFGRFLPALRPLAAQALIQLTARANGQFAALSSLPALLPFIGNLVGAAGDFLVLTKNQLLLLYKLAALYGRDLDDRRQVYIEMAPVVGAALVWRTVARELMALVPSFLGLVPKIAIAYAGTFVVGRAANFYYEEGRAPNADDWRRFYRQAQAWRAGLSTNVAVPAATDGRPRVEIWSAEQRSGPVVH